MPKDIAEECIKWLHPAYLPGAELLEVKQSARGWHCYHERYAVCACSVAASDWRYRGKDHHYSNCTTGFMEPGETHCNTRVDATQDFTVILIEAKTISDIAYECGIAATPHFRLAMTDDNMIYKAVQGLRASMELGATILEQQSRYFECIRLLLGFTEVCPQSAKNIDSGMVYRAKQYLIEHFRDPVSIHELASAAGASHFHIIHSFKRYFGIPPHAYQTLIRVERARALLKMGIAPSTVATDMGFSDQSHFTRKFHDIMKVTPGQYAKAF